MRLSRLRVRLAATFALTFLAVLALLNLILYGYLRTQFSHRFNQALQAESQELAVAITNELREGDGRITDVARATLEEWPTRDFGLAVLDPEGAVIATGGSPALRTIIGGPLEPGDRAVWELPDGENFPVRLAVASSPEMKGYRGVVAASTAPIAGEIGALLLWLVISAPIAILLSIVVGYVLVARALQPVRELEAQVASLDVDRLDGRLPVNAVPDELDSVAVQFNRLLDRLAAFRDANRKFLRQAAHQIRTPLTLVLGEASLSRDASGQPVPAMQRIRLAAEQMRRRVDDLFLLAQARSGERVTLFQDVELDGLALESTDLMRSRFTESGHHLELTEAAPVVVRGDEGLLREALVELLENACRHGDDQVVRVGTRQENGLGVIWVESGGPPIPERDGPPLEPDHEDHGVGLQVVRWIAEQHGGTLQVGRVGELNRVWIRIPARPEESA
ncbi:MAG: ATP-binding protein [Gemmatimonadota bacterium]